MYVVCRLLCLAALASMVLIGSAQQPSPSPSPAQASPAPAQPSPTPAADSPFKSPSTAGAGGMEILSDTMGVDFGPYIRKMKAVIESHWQPLIPAAALPPVMKQGEVLIRFSIKSNGELAAIRIEKSSGEQDLDRAAYGAVAYSAPLPMLPPAYQGAPLIIRAHFLYNPDKKKREEVRKAAEAEKANQPAPASH